jgi:integrase
MKLSLEHVNPVRKRLKSGEIATYYYHRKTGKRILGLPGTAEFMASYEAAHEPKVGTANGKTMAGLIAAYKRSTDFTAKAPSTRRLYDGYMEAINRRYGEVGLVAFDNRAIKGEVLAWRDELATTKAAVAHNLIRFFSTLLAWGEDRGFLEFNRLVKIKRSYQADRSDIVWEEDRVKALLKAAKPEVGRAVMLALFTGQRISDLVRLRWDWIKEGVLGFTQKKTGAYVGLPVVGEFKSLPE